MHEFKEGAHVVLTQKAFKRFLRGHPNKKIRLERSLTKPGTVVHAFGYDTAVSVQWPDDPKGPRTYKASSLHPAQTAYIEGNELILKEMT